MGLLVDALEGMGVVLQVVHFVALSAVGLGGQVGAQRGQNVVLLRGQAEGLSGALTVVLVVVPRALNIVQ